MNARCNWPNAYIDEAGQVSVANLVAISRSSKNLVIMGDQMQLGQPSQGTHPAESGLSILDYLLHESPTISDDMGVFLGTTSRMHSTLNNFISKFVYDGNLESHANNDTRIISIPNGYYGELDKQAGIVFIHVEHEGNTQASDEEVSKIKQLSKTLIGRTFTEKNGESRAIGWNDILFVVVPI